MGENKSVEPPDTITSGMEDKLLVGIWGQLERCGSTLLVYGDRTVGETTELIGKLQEIALPAKVGTMSHLNALSTLKHHYEPAGL